ncbi:MAG: site-specific DNA-methyltransferase [Candidatus Accumulibacter sp.]|jgi:adenine-specific DNA-methyltransferase|nr:site-specific DNA-methyltransferase [Accumulibacter sp.]
MAAIKDLLRQITDPALRERLSAEVDRLSKNKKFGLVFEEHVPECTPLYGIHVRRGSIVARKTEKMNDIYRVKKLDAKNAVCVSKVSGETTTIPLTEIVSVAQFGEPIFPSLEPIAKVANAPDNAFWHTLIEADNYHALQLLEYLYEGQVDCIYIDPPYNTGARDWKYNNDYVDSSDAWRHSKWLSMMQKRLKIAKRILSESGVIFISIDDGEQARLKLLCDEIFGAGCFAATIPWRKRTAKSDVPHGISQDYEWILCYANAGFEASAEGGGRKYFETDDLPGRPWRYHDLTKQTTAAERPNSFFTITNPKTGEEYPASPHRTWSITSDTFDGYYAEGRIIFPGDYDFLNIKKPVMRYFQEDDRKKDGDKFGLIAATTNLPKEVGMTQNGTKDVTEIFGEKAFSFPKPVTLIRYLLKIATNSDSLVVDFFAGSGTTLHAVNLLNAEDEGARRCVLVTNNEVSYAEQISLQKKGVQPNDVEWERHGICRSVTWPRTAYSIRGKRSDGTPLSGEYVLTDGKEKCHMSEGFTANVEYFKLGFLDKNSVSLGQQFAEILPLLWLKAGAVGERPELDGEELPDMLILPQNAFAVLLDEDCYGEFAEKLTDMDNIRTVYFVTNSEEAFREMSDGVGQERTCQLYRDYIDNFVIGSRRNKL